MPRNSIFRRFAILMIAPFVAVLVISPSPAMATLCGSTITTDWSTDLALLGDLAGTPSGDADFEGECETSPSTDEFSSIFSGFFEEKNVTEPEELDKWGYEIIATETDTLEILISATDGDGNGKKVHFPEFTLVLGNLWGGVEGTITAVVVEEASNFDLTVFDFAPDTITLTFAGEGINPPPLQCDSDGCTLDFYALISFTASHEAPEPIPIPDIPEPSTLGLFLVGLAGLGFALPRRRRRNAEA